MEVPVPDSAVETVADIVIDNAPARAAHPWPVCPEYAVSGPTLAEKTAYLDELVANRHLNDDLLRTVTLDPDSGEVVALHHLPSTGLWTAMYLASQSLRYAVTGNQQAVENARIASRGLHQLTAVTGIPGLYGRAYLRPDFVYGYDAANTDCWAPSPDPEYEGWWFNFDVSKDTMDGIMFGYSVALEHLEDEEIVQSVTRDVLDFVNYLVGNNLHILDYTGIVTEHGRINAAAMDDFPGFNAMLSASWIQTAISAGGGPELEHFYYDCLMRMGDYSDCPLLDKTDLGPYIDLMETTLSMYMPNCQTSYDNIDMVFQAIYPLLRRESEPDLLERLHALLEVGIWKPEDPGIAPAVHQSTHSLYIFMYGALASPTPDDPLFYKAVGDAVCSLYRLEQDRHDKTTVQGMQEVECINRLGDPNAAEIIPIEERYYDNYVWRLDPYEIPKDHTGTPNLVHSPEDYLLSYWMGRYFGYITEEM